MHKNKPVQLYNRVKVFSYSSRFFCAHMLTCFPSPAEVLSWQVPSQMCVCWCLIVIWAHVLIWLGLLSESVFDCCCSWAGKLALLPSYLSQSQVSWCHVDRVWCNDELKWQRNTIWCYFWRSAGKKSLCAARLWHSVSHLLKRHTQRGLLLSNVASLYLELLPFK